MACRCCSRTSRTAAPTSTSAAPAFARHAPNRANAIRFLEYLTSDFAQRIFAEGNNEYPVVGDATGPIARLGSFREDAVNATVLGANQELAVKIFDRAGWQ